MYASLTFIRYTTAILIALFVLMFAWGYTMMHTWAPPFPKWQANQILLPLTPI